MQNQEICYFEVSALDGTNVLQSLNSIVKVMYEHALKYGIARSSLHLNNAQLAADAAERKQRISLLDVDVSNGVGTIMANVMGEGTLFAYHHP